MQPVLEEAPVQQEAPVEPKELPEEEDALEYEGYFGGGGWVSTDTEEEPMELPTDHVAAEGGEDANLDPTGGDAGDGGDGADPDDHAGDAAEEDGYGPDDSDGDGDELEDPPTPDAAAGGRPIPPFEKVYTTWTQSRESFWLHFGGLCSTLVSS